MKLRVSSFRERPTEQVNFWRKLGEVVNQYLEKGSQVFVEGEVRGDASDGSRRRARLNARSIASILAWLDEFIKPAQKQEALAHRTWSRYHLCGSLLGTSL